jgi:RNA polymerase sigma factor (sigma-70 family)
VVTTAPRRTRVVRLVDGDVDGPSDAALLTAVALGDGDACRTFVDRHASRVLGVAVSVCRDRTLAEDVSQRAFEQAWRHAASFDPARASARTWLLTITRRLAIDELRRRRISPVAPDDLLGLLAPAAADTERAGLASAGRARVIAALRTLPDEQCRAVVLASLGGHSAREVAEIEDVPLGTAKTRIRLGLRRLRAELADEVDHG